MRPLLALSLLLTACGEPSSRAAAADRAAPADAIIYSPFVVQLQSDTTPFSVISFKDVGMSLPEEERSVVYESLAEGISLELTSMHSSVEHDPSAADPAHHLSCEGQHVYVDVWQRSGGWGYSLWSGCGEDDQFGRHEVAAASGEDPIASVDPLAVHIAASLRDAVATGCFTRAC